MNSERIDIVFAGSVVAGGLVAGLLLRLFGA